MRNLERENDMKLESASVAPSKPMMSKKRRMKIDKIQRDETLSAQEKEKLIRQLQLEDGEQESKRVKRSQISDFKDKKNFLSHERPSGEYDAGTGKVNQSSLWGEDERNFLEDVTLNLVPDDDTMMDIKGKTVMKWDSKKKRHVL